MNFFNFNLKKTLIIILIAVLPLISINMEQKQTSNLWFAQPISYLTGQVQSFFSSISELVQGTTAEYVNLLNIKKDNKNLKLQITELQANQTQLMESQNEVDRLRLLLNFKAKTKMNLVAAQVIGRDLAVDHQTITINKGLNDGIKAQQAVITIQGAVGYVFKPEKTMSHVILLTDRYSVTDAIIQKSRSHAIVEGLGNDSGVLQFVDRDENIQVGDLIVTGGLDEIYPQGFPLATVSEILRKPNSSVRVLHVTPVSQSEKIEEVFVITKTDGENFLKNEDSTAKNESIKKTEPKND